MATCSSYIQVATLELKHRAVVGAETRAERRADCRAVIVQMPSQNLMQIIVQKRVRNELRAVQSSMQMLVQK